MINKVYISYFYQIRNMKPYMIPLSTAVWNPKWYVKDYGFHLDKNGVINGLRCMELVPGSQCNSLCRGTEVCTIKDPTKCSFLRKYKEQLDAIDFNKFMEELGYHLRHLERHFMQKDNEFIPIFIVYETPDNPCSERTVIMDWFRRNNVECIEFNKNDFI